MYSSISLYCNYSSLKNVIVSKWLNLMVTNISCSHFLFHRNVYVTSYVTNSILRFDGQTGWFIVRRDKVSSARLEIIC